MEIPDALKMVANAFVKQVRRKKETVIELIMRDIDFTDIPFLMNPKSPLPLNSTHT